MCIVAGIQAVNEYTIIHFKGVISGHCATGGTRIMQRFVPYFYRNKSIRPSAAITFRVWIKLTIRLIKFHYRGSKFRTDKGSLITDWKTSQYQPNMFPKSGWEWRGYINSWMGNTETASDWDWDLGIVLSANFETEKKNSFSRSRKPVWNHHPPRGFDGDDQGDCGGRGHSQLRRWFTQRRKS